jgi:membrane protein implicated in regulation of membrane protease activity
MTWESFYLVCFLVGLLLSALSLVGGMGHIGGHLPAGHFPTRFPHGAGMGHVGQLPHPGHLGQGTGLRTAQGGATVPWWNAFSIMIFLCWFGAAGYLLTRHGSFVAMVVLVLAGICGVAGGAIVFFFLAKVMLPHEHELTADETEVVGVVGRVSAPIRAGGTGEIVYEQMGERCSAPARSEDGVPIQKQEEVYVIRYEKGVAYVRRWEDLLSASDQLSVVGGQSEGAELDSDHRPEETHN